MESKFKLWAYFVAFLFVVSSGIVTMMLSGNLFNPNMPLGFFIFFSLFILYMWFWLIFGELRTKVICIHFEYSTFTIKRYLGLGQSTTFDFDNIGYKTSILSSHSDSYEYFYLMFNNKKVAKLSEFYHENYKELKQEVISQNVKDLGFERFSYFREFKEIFQKN